MIERTISQSMYDARVQELDTVKEAIYKENIDNLTCRMTRKKSIGEWTEQDQVEYDKANAHCQELIAVEEAKPLFNSDEKLVVVTDEEYEKQLKEIEDARIKVLEEEEAKRKAEQEAANKQTVTDVDESLQGEIPSVRDYKNGEQVF